MPLIIQEINMDDWLSNIVTKEFLGEVNVLKEKSMKDLCLVEADNTVTVAKLQERIKVYDFVLSWYEKTMEKEQENGN